VADYVIDLLIDKIIEKNNPSVVGLDPRLSFVPDFIKKEAFEKYGKTPNGAAECFYVFNKYIIDAVFNIVPAVKPQIAMYEQFGAPGIDCYVRTIEYAKEKGLVVIGDIKRNDIASTAEAYSDGHIGRVDVDGADFEIYKEDFITINPYLGTDSIEPFIKNCKEYGKGLFVLIKTSNPKSGVLQDLEIDGELQAKIAANLKREIDGSGLRTESLKAEIDESKSQNKIDGIELRNKRVYERVAELISEQGLELIGKHGYSLIGGVVGATYPEQARRLRLLMPQTFFLVPGYGAQGGDTASVKACFSQGIIGAVVNSSRGIIAAHQNEKYKNTYSEEDFALCARQACMDMRDDILEAISGCA